MQEINLKLAVEDVNMILEGVGTLPFARVYTLVGKIQEQAAQQLRANLAAAPGPQDARGESGAAN
jgi:hypothetical protein